MLGSVLEIKILSKWRLKQVSQKQDNWDENWNQSKYWQAWIQTTNLCWKQCANIANTMHCTQKGNLITEKISHIVHADVLTGHSPPLRINYSLFSWRCSASSCLGVVSPKYPCADRGNHKKEIIEVSWRSGCSHRKSTYLCVFKVNEKLEAFPISDLEHSIYIQTGETFVENWGKQKVNTLLWKQTVHSA